MENNRDSGRKDLRPEFSIKTVRPLLWLSLALAFISGLCFLGSALIPNGHLKYQTSASLEALKKQERSIKNQFESLISNLKYKGHSLATTLPQEIPEIHQALFSLHLNPEIEGVAYLIEDSIILWRGQMIPASLLPPADKITHVIRYKASIYLVASFPVREKEKLVILHLLSFQPPLTTSLLSSYSFIKAKDLTNALIEFYSEEDDVSGFEKIFFRHHDEYISQPRSRTDILTIFFPLRNEARRIVATVNLRSVNPAFSLSEQRSRWLLAAWINLFLSFSFFTLMGLFAWKKSKYQSTGNLIIFLFGLISLRLVFLPLKTYFDIKTSLFSPGKASIPALNHLLASPLDIFLTSALIFACLFFLIYNWRHIFPLDTPSPSRGSKKGLALILVITSSLPLYLFYKIALAFILNSNLNLIKISPFSSSLLLLLALSFIFLTAILISGIFLIVARKLWFHPFPLWLIFIPLLLLFILFYGKAQLSLVKGLVLSLIFFGIYLGLFKPPFRFRSGYRLTLLALSSIFFYIILASGTSIKETILTESYLRNSIISLENWAQYLLQESLPSIDNEKEAILDCLLKGDQNDLAAYLWRKTSLARWNWYSSLEISRPNGEVLSRYSLNLPFFFRTPFSFEPSQDWSLLRVSLPLPGKVADFLIAYRDFEHGGNKVGRLSLYVLLNEEILPFLYSAIPYFDLLRFPSVPSLKEFNFSLAIFKTDGEIIFNPARLTTGIPVEILKRLKDHPGNPFWSILSDRRRKFRVFYFGHGEKIVALLWPLPGFISVAVGYLKILLILTILIYLPLFISDMITGRRRLASLFWAFSSRIYASFIAIILIMLIPFIFLINSFFNRLATERFREKAEIQAQVARNIIEDFLVLQEEETPFVPVQDLVHWISTAINNDVNIYQGGVLVASSRQEFFDLGLLPDYLEGEIAYRLNYERQPYVVWRKKIGNYSFQTLTLPLYLNNSNFFITLFFPFEREEIGRAREQLLEFLAFISAFSLILISLFARSIGSLVINPIRKLLLATKEVSSGNLDIRIDHHGHDEMQTLIDGFNRMVQSLKQHEKELAEMSKKAAWAEMARKVAHEVKNPLTPIRLSAEHLLHVYEERPQEIGPALKEAVAYIIKEVENLRRLAQDFLTFSREGPLHKTYFELNQLLKEITSPYERILADRINFEFNLACPLTLMGDQEKLKIAFRNLIVNAIEAIKGKGIIKIQATREGSFFNIEIIDNGEGMDETTLRLIFEPHFSTKDLGTGLGLPISKKIIEDHGGQIIIRSSPGQGTCVKIVLPAG